MRFTSLLAAALLAGCSLPYLRPAPGQAVPGDPVAGAVEAGGLRLTARADDWRGWPQDLSDRLTPVAVLVENQGGPPLDLGPADFTLRLPDGRTFAPLPTAQVRSLLGARLGGAASVLYPEAVPGAFGPHGVPGTFPPAALAGQVRPLAPFGMVRPVGRAELGPGERRSLLLLFEVPAARQAALALELRPVAAGADAAPAGPPLRLDFTRRAGAAGAP